MKSSLLILASVALLANAGIAQAKGHGMSAPPTGLITPPIESSVPPPVNPGALSSPAEFGTPPVNSGALGLPRQATINNQFNDGALPGAPGSSTYDPNAALPSLDNQGSALAPNPGTSAFGFRNP